ncbi:hypothetical protein DDZ14_14425 [Maritimibacter sp. 55A14]|uniref:FliM/FliN family flagellar motor switch protein n=1 Tax=Maritimibacter sp. 55A14 TaxID=2174844 RepID=UPI000D60C103|nr:FliM/FliN family flagellar motor switch protein [Maritimibacter sp. 55A14]PWE30628.1 hypothetical protein DDZ14_14425 [Maritimibacter sp. 55A14]
MSDQISPDAPETAVPVLRRMLSAGRGHASACGAEMAEGLRRAAAAAARSRLGLGCDLDAIEGEVAGLEEMLAAVPRDALIALVSREGGSGGLVAMDAALVEALVAIRITGRVPRGAETDGSGRRALSTVDAALARDFIDALLAGLDRVPGLSGAARLRFADYLTDPAPLRYSLPAGGWLRVTFELRLGAESPVGRMLIALPQRAGAAPPGPQVDPDADWSARLDAALGTAPIRLNAVLDRMRLPLARLKSLAPGDAIELRAGVLSQVTLVSAEGRRICTGRLGQARGHRALRIGPEPPALTHEMVELDEPGQAPDTEAGAPEPPPE